MLLADYYSTHTQYNLIRLVRFYLRLDETNLAQFKLFLHLPS